MAFLTLGEARRSDELLLTKFSFNYLFYLVSLVLEIIFSFSLTILLNFALI